MEPEDDDNVKALSESKERASERKKTLDSLREGVESLEMYREDIGSKINMKQEQLKEIERRRNLVIKKRMEKEAAKAAKPAKPAAITAATTAATSIIANQKKRAAAAAAPAAAPPQPTMEEIGQLRVDIYKQKQ